MTQRIESGLEKSALIRELVDLSRFTDGILKTMRAGVVAVGEDGAILYVNPAAEKLLGQPAADLLRRPADSILRTRDEEPLWSKGSLPDGAEIELALAPDKTVSVEARVSRFDDPVHGDGVVILLSDLTEVRNAQAQARRNQRFASLGELSAAVAHEIRNPLAGISTSAQLVRSRLEEGDSNVKLMDIILEESRRLNRIVESMLTYAKPPQPRLTKSPVLDSLDRAVHLVRDRADGEGIRLDTRYQTDLPSAWIDSEQLEQVYLNLLQNSIQATPSGGAITVNARTISRPAHVRTSPGRRREDHGQPPPAQPPTMEWVEVEIADTGHGMPRDVLARVFDPFYTTRRDGTGLGLAICKSIVSEHAGQLSVDSVEGKGTTVKLDIPVEKRLGQRRRAGDPSR